MSRPAGEGLAAALLGLAGEGARLLAAGERPWVSVTLAGARHRLAIELPAAGAARFAGAVAEAELAVRGHLVADVAVTAREALGPIERLTLEALTVAEAARAAPRNEAAVVHVARP